jgi:hypothetical protein
LEGAWVGVQRAILPTLHLLLVLLLLLLALLGLPIVRRLAQIAWHARGGWGPGKARHGRWRRWAIGGGIEVGGGPIRSHVGGHLLVYALLLLRLLLRRPHAWRGSACWVLLNQGRTSREGSRLSWRGGLMTWH